MAVGPDLSSRTIIVCVLATVSSVCCRPALAQQSILVGTVTSDSAGKRPIANAQISLSTPPRTIRVDSAGSYRIDGLARGHYLVTVRSIGYIARYDTVTIDSDDATLRDFVLTRFVAQLTPVVTKAARVNYISPMLRGFEDRRAEGFGHFIPEATLRTKDNERLSEIIAAYAPGLQIVRAGQHNYAASTRKGSATALGKGPCYSTIYLDGVMLYDAGGSHSMLPPTMDDFNVDQLGGVEFYGGEATAPAGYRSSVCGLLLLWTREK
jgi:carboxypeptidase family protein